ncbi:MAG: putative glycosyltransferase [uncultured Sulfurovum sp.]|uniref:Putative glycosyltransferase n=1 Tax=uncultured Sulfurovum sp. TaxID=269237 RepID=A0A6S6TH91_9BACT|nr:MAG: putative glycosyltransferase [uncultured Sulfurovum sp.]
MKKVLVIGYVYPEPNSSAAGTHILSIMRRFKKEHWDVTFSTPAQESEHAIDLASEGIDSQPITLNCDSFDQYISSLQPNIVLFDRFMMEEQFGWRVEKNCPTALKILDTEDLQCLRNARHQAHKAKRETSKADLFSDLAKREIASILRCDLSLIVSSYEMQLLTETFNVDNALLHHLPFMVDLEKVPKETKSFEERQHFMTIGNFRHAPNWDVVLYLKEIWSDIRKKLPKAELHVYGSYPPPKAMQLHSPKTGFHIKGWAEDAHEVMENAKVCLAPIRFGAGIKGKLLDAIICQTPSVTSSIGSEGMHEQESWGGAVEDDVELFVEASVLLYTQEDKWEQAQKNAIKLLHAKYNGDKLGNQLIEKIVNIEENLEEHRLNNFTGAMLKHHSMQSTKYMSQWIEVKSKCNC